MTPRDQYVARMKLQLDELNRELAQLVERGYAAKDEVQMRFEIKVAGLRADSNAARAQLDQVRTAGEDGWPMLVSEMERRRDTLRHSSCDFSSQL